MQTKGTSLTGECPLLFIGNSHYMKTNFVRNYAYVILAGNYYLDCGLTSKQNIENISLIKKSSTKLLLSLQK